MEENDSIKDVGLPEVYLSPSKKIYKQNTKDNVWKTDKTTVKEDDFNSYRSGSRPISAKQKPLTKGTRGETPGSDSPRNTAAAQTAVSINTNFVSSTTKIPNKSSYNPERDKFKISIPEGQNYVPSFQRSPLDGALSNEDANFSQQSNSLLSEDQEVMELMQRNSPPGNSNKCFLNLNSGEEEDGSYSTRPDSISKLVRPPALGQSEDMFQIYKGNRKDLGSSDGEDSSTESIKQTGKDQVKTFMEGCSLGSQSENTDSTTTVLDMKREPIQGCEDEKSIPKTSDMLSKPNFLVGGAISPRVVSEQKGSLVEFKRPLSSDIVHEPSRLRTYPNSQLPLEQDDSLNSMISVESTQHPESSECFTSPSAISVSSVASSKKLEWDSSADVGYASKTEHQECLATSLSTLERIAIGSYASVLRTEPEGKGTNQVKGKMNKKSNISREKISTTKSREIQFHKISRYSANGRKGIQLSFVNTNKYRNQLSSDEEYLNKSAPTSPGKMSRRQASYTNKKSFSYTLQDSQVKHKDQKIFYAKDKTCSLSALPCSSKQETVHEDIEYINPNQVCENSLSKSCITKTSSNASTNSGTLVNSISSLPVLSPLNQNEFSVLSKNTEKMQSLECNKKAQYKNYGKYYVKTKQQLHEVFKDNSQLFDANNSKKTSLKLEENSVTNLEELPTKFKSNTTLTEILKNKSDVTTTASVDVLETLSKKLKLYVDNLMETGAIKKFDDYNKLHDYVEFVALPSTNDEEVELKQSVADIIMRLFGDINNSNAVFASSTPNSEELESQDYSLQSISLNPSNIEISQTEIAEVDKKSSEDSSSDKEKMISSEGKILYVPYRPPSATRTYYITTSEVINELDLRGETESKLSEQSEHPHSSSEACASNSASISLRENENSPHPRDDEENTKSADQDIDNVPTSSSKVFYQDWHGTYHVAHQPPGYSSCIDSHQSDSTSDNEIRKNNRQPEEVNLNLPVWTSTGSESAYETIRERHRNVGEALASSFEFYSTSPRDARALGYVSADNSDNVANNDNEYKSDRSTSDMAAGVEIASYKSSERENISSSTTSSRHKNFTPRKTTKKITKKNRSQQKTQKMPTQNYSAISDTDGASSTVSVIQMQRQKYVKRIRKYISTLEKLERALVPSGDSFVATENNDILSSNSNLFSSNTYNARPVILDFPSSSSSRFVSSEYADTPRSSLGIEDTFIKHRTSFKKKGSDEYTSSLSQSNESPRDTSTLRSHKTSLKKNKNKDENEYDERSNKDNYNMPEFKNEFGRVSDFRKLMASKEVPGEIRPYRYLLKNKESDEVDVGTMKRTEDRESRIKRYAKSKTSSSDEKELIEINQRKDSLSSRRQRSYKSQDYLGSSYKSQDYLGSKPQESLVKMPPQSYQESFSTKPQDSYRFKEPLVTAPQESYIYKESQQRPHILMPDESYKSQESMTRSQEFMATSQHESEMTRLQELNTNDLYVPKYREIEMEDNQSSSLISEGAIKPSKEKIIGGNFKAKETKDFGQIFPSDSIFNFKNTQCSVSVQTGQSLLELKESDKPNKSTTSKLATDEDTSFFSLPPTLPSPPIIHLPDTVSSTPPLPSPSPLPSLPTSIPTSPKIHRSSTLGDMEKRIQKNAEKIEAALAAYNNKFASAELPSSLILPKARSSSSRNTMNETVINNLAKKISTSSEILDHSSNTLNNKTDQSLKYNHGIDILNVATIRSIKVTIDPSLRCTKIIEDSKRSTKGTENPELQTTKPIEDSSKTASKMIENTALRSTKMMEDSSRSTKITEDPSTKEKQSFKTTKELIVLPKNKKSLKFTVTITNEARKTLKNKSQVEELIEYNKENEIMSLQEALLLAKPSYVREAEKRRLKICRKQAIRQKVQSHNQDVLAELPDNIKTPTVLQKFLFKSTESPVFSYTSMRKQNQRLYQLLPEAQRPKVVKKKDGMSKSNRLMAKFYSQKLRRKVVSGKVSHNHREVMTPIR